MEKDRVKQLEWSVWDWLFGSNGTASAGAKG
jgi:hypothetical protein